MPLELDILCCCFKSFKVKTVAPHRRRPPRREPSREPSAERAPSTERPRGREESRGDTKMRHEKCGRTGGSSEAVASSYRARRPCHAPHPFNPPSAQPFAPLRSALPFRLFRPQRIRPALRIAAPKTPPRPVGLSRRVFSVGCCCKGAQAAEDEAEDDEMRSILRFFSPAPSAAPRPLTGAPPRPLPRPPRPPPPPTPPPGVVIPSPRL